MNEFIEGCRRLIGSSQVLVTEQDQAPYLTDWRRRFTGRAMAVLRPANASETAALVRLCRQHRVPIVPQGGNTGLVLGSVPDQSGQAVVISLQRVNAVRAIDPLNNTITVDAGCPLAIVQRHAENAGRLFPLSLASEGSCTLGGNLATNAGGTGVIRYGNARELCLGLEVVTADGEVWDGLRGLRKDNTGYDLRDLFIGSEGTLGIITAAVMKLFPQPRARLTALVALDTVEEALQLLTLAQQRCAAGLTGFELISRFSLELVARHFPQLPRPLPLVHEQYALIELSDHESEDHATALLESLMSEAMERGWVQDAALAATLAQAEGMWSVREHVSMAQAAEGKNVKHDVSVPVSKIGDFVRETDLALQAAFPGVRMVTFGHLGDGNLHYNVSPPVGIDDNVFITRQHEVNRVVHDSVHRFDGSISAEHGLGALKRDEIRRYKSTVEMNLMRTIKRALDPEGIMNPGKVL